MLYNWHLCALHATNDQLFMVIQLAGERLPNRKSSTEKLPVDVERLQVKYHTNIMVISRGHLPLHYVSPNVSLVGFHSLPELGRWK